MSDRRQRPRSEDLQEHDLTRAKIRMAHLREVQTGYRSGSRFWAQLGEPRPEYDPEHTTLTERRRADMDKRLDFPLPVSVPGPAPRRTPPTSPRTDSAVPAEQQRICLPGASSFRTANTRRHLEPTLSLHPD